MSRIENSTLPSAGFGSVTPNDTGIINYTRALYVGGGGDLTVIREDGIAVLFKAVPTGALLPIRVNGVMATGTTATYIVALW